MAYGRADDRADPYGRALVMTGSSGLRAVVHGGPDAGPAIRIDFSTNAHPFGANPFVREAVERADRSRYPDPHYTSLRAELAAGHGVATERIVVGASASELIWRLTRCWSASGSTAVLTDERTFGEYLRAARVLGVPIAAARSAWPATNPVLHWYCNPDNPSGAHRDDQVEAALQIRGDCVVADLAYWPFRVLLSDVTQPATLLTAAWADRVTQLWSPNKLYGMTGVRGAYLVLPTSADPRVNADVLTDSAPSWVLGVDGVALLQAHLTSQAAQFLRDTAPVLRNWKADQDRRLQDGGWRPEASPLHYGLWRPPVRPSEMPGWHARLREAGIKVRDARSFGRPNWIRLVSRAPGDVTELLTATQPFRCNA
jgi:histidinol-phosphate aminotransferase